MFNTGFRGKRASDGTGIINPQENFVQNKYPVPTITSWTISGSDDDALDPAGGQTVLVNGGGFVAGCAASVNGVTITPVTVISANQISFTSPALAGGSYTLIVYNSTGGGAILVPGLVYSSVPTYTTAAGSIGSGYETTDIDTSVVATSDSSITYTVTSGALPDGASMTTGGVITGTYPILSSGSSETFYFDITATDAEDQDVTRSFSLTTNIDVVSWVTPSNGATITLDGTAYSQALNATDAAGYSVSYSANALPTGLTLDSGTISGTPTSEESVTTLLTATAATTNRSATNTITWVVALGDTFWKNVTLLLSGSTPTPAFINDASLNNSQLTIAGDTKPTKFTTYADGYYSYTFDGASYALGTTPTTNANYGVTIGTQDFCLEAWGCWTSFNYGSYGAPLVSLLGQSAGELMIRATKTSGNTTSANFFSILGASTYIPSSMFSSGVSVGTLYLNRWHHLAIQRISGTWYFYIDGVMLNSTSAGNASLTLPFTRFYIGSDAASGGGYMAGNVSNVRLSVGTAPYASGGFTVPTSPLPYLPTTKFLSAQSNRLVDNGPINSTFTVGGTGVRVALLSPFNQPTTGRVPTLFSTHFDGTSGYISTPHNSQLSMDSGDFSAECWCYRTCSVSGESATLINKSGTGYVTVPQWLVGSKNGYWAYNIGSSGSSGTTFINVQTTTLVVPDIWHHVALIKTGTTYSMFVDGTRISTTTNATVPLDNNPLGLSIGFQFAQTSVVYWWGQICDVRINKGTLPAGYDATATTLTVPTEKLTAVTGTVLLTCQDSTLKDNSTNNFPFTSISPAAPFPVSPFEQIYTSTSVTSLGATYFDGTGDYLAIPVAPQLAFASDYTIECWVYLNSVTGLQGVYSSIDSSGDTWQGPYLGFSGTSFLATSYISSPDVITHQTTVAIGRWYHIAMVRSGTITKSYLNGIQSTGTTTSSYSLTQSGGTVGSAYPGTSPLNGYISDLRVVKGTALYTANFLPPQQPLTPVTNTQLLTLQYNGGATNNGIIDQSGYNNNLTRYGNITQGTFSPFSQTGWSNYFNRSRLNSTLTGKAPGTGSFTYELFFNVAVKDAAIANVAALFSTRGGGSGADGFDVEVTTAGAILIGSSGAVFLTSSTGLVTDNLWYHLAIVRNGTTNWTVYLNGSSIGTISNSTNFTSVDLYLGVFGGATQDWFKGYMSNFRYTRSAVYTSNFTTPNSPLTVLTNTEYLTLQDNRRIDKSPNNFTVTYTALNGTSTMQAYSPFSGVTSTPLSYSSYFDGTGDSLTVGSTAISLPTATTPFTIEAWVYITAFTGLSIMATNYSSGGIPFWFGLNNGTNTTSVPGGYPVLAYYSGTTWNYVVQSTSANSTQLSLNTWYHIAGVYSGTTAKIFVNGTETVSVARTTWQTTASAAGGINVGRKWDTSTGAYFSGYISNARLVIGTAVYTDNFTPSTTPLTAITNTTLLTCQNSTLVDNSTNSFAITVAGDTTPSSFNPFGMTTSTNVSYSPSIHGSSLFMDGTGDYLTAPNTKSFDLNSGNWCIECWFYQLVPKQVQLFSVSAAAWRLAVDTSGGAGFTFNTSSTTTYPSGSFPAGQWNHIAATFEFGATTQQKSFANGKYVNGGALYPNADTTSLFYVGNNKDAAGAWDFNGYMTDIKITRGDPVYRASFVPSLIPAQLTNTTAFLLNGSSGGALDYHSSNDLETVGNTTLAGEDPYAGNYYSTQLLSSGYLTTPANGVFDLVGSGGTFTLEAWVYFNSYNTMASSAAVMAGNFQTSSGWFWGFYGTNTISYLTYTAYTSASGTPANFSIDASHVPLGKWVHIATVNNSGTMTTYLNGVATGGTTSAPSYTGSGGQLAIGVYQQNLGYSGNPNWYISNLRITKGVAVYTGNFTVPTGPLTATQSSGTNISAITGTSTSVLTCQSNMFRDNSTNAFTLTRNTAGAIASRNPFQQNTGKSLYFDGTGDYIANYTGSVNLVDDKFIMQSNFTVEAWIYPTSTNIVIFVLGNENANRFIFYLSSGNQLAYDIYLVGTTTFTPTITQRCWTHVALTRSGSTITCYINGVSVGTGTNAGILGNGPLSIGTNGSRNGAYWAGYITDLRITKGVARTITVPSTPYQTK